MSTDKYFDSHHRLCRIFSDSPLEKKQIEEFFLNNDQKKITPEQSWNILYDGYYSTAIKNLSSAFPDNEFSALYTTHRSTHEIWIEKWKAGKIISRIDQYTYATHPICHQFQDILNYFHQKHQDFAILNGHHKEVQGQIINEHEFDCPCQFCFAIEIIAKQIDNIVNEIIDENAKNLHELTQCLPEKKKWMDNLILACH